MVTNYRTEIILLVAMMLLVMELNGQVSAEENSDSESIEDVNYIRALERKVNMDAEINASLNSIKGATASENSVSLSFDDGAKTLSNKDYRLLQVAKSQIGRLKELKGKKVYLVAGRYVNNSSEKASNEATDEVVFTYYNYDIQYAVDVYIQDNKVNQVKLLNKDYQPPVSRDEIEDAMQQWTHENTTFKNYPQQYIEPRVLIGTDKNNNRIIYFQNRIKDKSISTYEINKQFKSMSVDNEKKIYFEDITKPVIIDLSK